jgi:hypothetical protein
MKTNFVAEQNDFEVYFSITFHMKVSDQKKSLASQYTLYVTYRK